MDRPAERDSERDLEEIPELEFESQFGIISAWMRCCPHPVFIRNQAEGESETKFYN